MPKKIGFDEGAAELAEENKRKKEKLIHIVLHGEDLNPGETHISDYPPPNPIEGQMWVRTSDTAILLWYIDSFTGKGQWMKTYEK